MTIERTVYALATVALVSLAANVGLTASLVAERTPAAPIVTYSLVSEAADGNVYVNDTGMTLADCRNAPDTGAPVQYCEVEAPPSVLIGYGCDGATGTIYAREESDMPRCKEIVRSKQP